MEKFRLTHKNLMKLVTVMIFEVRSEPDPEGVFAGAPGGYRPSRGSPTRAAGSMPEQSPSGLPGGSFVGQVPPVPPPGSGTEDICQISQVQ